MIDALHKYPHMNASVGDGELVVHNYVNLSVAVDLDFEGLLAPVVQGADRQLVLPQGVEDADARGVREQPEPLGDDLGHRG